MPEIEGKYTPNALRCASGRRLPNGRNLLIQRILFRNRYQVVSHFANDLGIIGSGEGRGVAWVASVVGTRITGGEAAKRLR